MTEPLVEPATLSPGALSQEYLGCLLAADGRRARRLVEDGLAAGVPAATLYLEVIAPVMHEIGRLWETAQVSVAQEHLATQITQATIASLGLHLAGGEPVGAGRVAVVAASPGERHALGGQMVADFLEAQDWTVLSLGPDTPLHELVGLVKTRGAALVALSTALPGHLLSVTRTCQLLRRLSPSPYIVVGGRAYGGDAGRARAVGADGFADDPRALLGLLAAEL
ncbi:MAG TPA: B12-binding domain-containing protein [Solirubrobacteraceae bacterium]|nr:B12-binding domain-containing protein [Solirubrobacteraceae bacterium]